MHYLFTYFQLQGRYGRILLSFCLKSFLPLTGFTAMLWLGYGLLAAILLMTVIFLLTLAIYDIPRMKDFGIKGFTVRGIHTILKESFPLMLSTLALPYMLFFIRYAVESLFGREILGYFSAVSMVTVIMTTLAGSVWFVIIPILSERFVSRNFVSLQKQIFFIIIILLVITAILVPLGQWLGGWVFSLIFGTEILPHLYLLPMTIISSGFLTVATFLSTVLIAIRKRVLMLASMLLGAIFLTALAFPFAKAYGSVGALYAFASAVILQSIPMSIIIIRTCRKGTL
jgi:O-antigen/teichoic acid export membrane protein